MIEVTDLSKTFHIHKKAPGLKGSIRALFVRDRVAKHAVKAVNLKIEPGEIVGLIGPNGAGKTTLVKMLAGIIHPTSGDARVLGHQPWLRHNDFRRRIALVMGQKAQLWWDLPAADGFLLLKEIYRIEDRRYRKNLDYLSAILGVEDLLTTQVRRLSLGERMKMELIAALLHDPKVVYLDEPTIGLDLTAQRAVRDFILEYRERHNPAIVLTSHYMEDIQRLCKRIVILRDGAIVFDGQLEEVVRRFAPSKLVTAHLRKHDVGSQSTTALARFGEVVACDPDQICIRVARDQVAEVAGYLLQSFPVVDLAIQEDDVGTIIERITRTQSGTPLA